jgi:hypothetical protein
MFDSLMESRPAGAALALVDGLCALTHFDIPDYHLKAEYEILVACFGCLLWANELVIGSSLGQTGESFTPVAVLLQHIGRLLAAGRCGQTDTCKLMLILGRNWSKRHPRYRPGLSPSAEVTA